MVLTAESTPGHLTIYGGNSCNLACSYCYVAVNQAPAVRLDWERMRRGIDLFLDKTAPAARRVTFLGGEPLLDFPLLARAVRYLRRKGAAMPLTVFTNGTLLDAAKARFLLDEKVRIVLSLDGGRATNDASRRFASGSKASVYRAVAERLESLPIERLELNMVFVPSRVARLPEEVFALRAKGFRNFSFYPDLYGDWTPAAVARARRALARLARRYAALFDAPGAEPFVIRDLPLAVSRAADPDWWRSCGNLVLGGDGTFHSCDKALSFPVGRVPDSAVGSLEAGVDWSARRGAHERSAAAVDRLAPGRKFLYCPMGTELHSGWSGTDAAARLASFADLGDALGGFYRGLARALEGNPAFVRLYPGLAKPARAA